ncbi:MAG: formate dehydrogenase subunit alpha [Gammaproteobacteria bacterium]|nr:formate dehydrogenase subunit alpha [Gammaproteobacteria bacterium]
MSKTVSFTLNGKTIAALDGETIWQAAHRENMPIPHLCHLPEPDYRPDGNCRACVVEIEGERVLAASCLRKPTEGMVVRSDSRRARKSQSLVMELLIADQPSRELAPERDSRLWKWAETLNMTSSRFPAREPIERDFSHPAMHVALNACIQCNLCVRACREVQVNDVIGMAKRGHQAKIVFDFDDPMGASTCVACGECIQACPTGALMESTRVNEDGIDQTPELDEVDSVCPYCGVGCQITYQSHNNEIIAVKGRNGPSNRNRLCVKGRFGFDYVKHPHRLTKPLIRIDKTTKSANLKIDPSNFSDYFREVSWDEALDYAVSGLKQIRDQHGSSAMAGFGSAKCTNEEAYIFQKLIRAGFGTNNVDHCTRLCHASSVAALLEGIGSGAVSAPFMAAEDSDCIILIGANPTSNHPVAATFFKQVAKQGTTLILMDPRRTQLQRYATHTLQFKPGTDVAMLNALLHTIVKEELYDQQYVNQNTEGFESLCKHIHDFSPENMQSICGIDAETLKTVARKYATSKASIIFWGMGISQHVHGTDNARCLIALSLITGQIGRRGTGLHPLRGQNNVQGASDAGLIPMMYPDYQPVFEESPKARFEDVWGTTLDPDKGLTVVEIMQAIHHGKIHAMYIMGENPAMSDPDVKHARDALASLQHLVVQDIFLTETAFHADVILPASAWPEKDGTVTNTNRQIQMGRKVLNLPGEARPDWWITTELGKHIGMEWDYRGPSDIYQEMSSVMPSLNNITWERIDRESSVTYPCDAPDLPGNEIVFEDRFPTLTGKGKIVPAGIISPDELPDAEYPMILSTGRQLEHWHTGAMTRRASVLDNIEPEAVATLSSDTLQRLNVMPGRRIQVSTRRGSIELVARMDNAVPDNMVFVPFCYVEAAANLLTNSALDPIGKIPEFKFCAAKVSAI